MAAEFEKTLNIGHRGAAALAPENTLLSFSLALELGADGVELDVHETADGRFAVHHDPQISGLPICSAAFAELKLRFPQNGERGLVRLEDVLGLLSGGDRPVAFIEVKGLRSAPGLIRLLDPWRERLRINIQSFDRRILTELDTDRRDLPADRRPALGLIANDPGADPAADLASLGAEVLSLRRSALSRSLIDDLHSAGVLVTTWTVNDKAGIRDVLEMGIDGVISDRPDRVRKVMERA